MKSERLFRPGLLGALLLMVACSPEATPVPTPMPSATARPTATPTLTPTPTDSPTATPTPGPLSAAEVFALVSPSVAFVRTEIAGGSGVLIEGGFLLTNAHVVWPYNVARVVFPDGSEFAEAPIHSWDLMADLALIGPLDNELPVLELQDGEDRAIGSDVYLVGYPGEVGDFPQPTFGRGLISRLREWEALGITYFQTDASITGGQSGGILVADRGEVIGISGLRFTDVSYGVIASAADILPRIDTMRDAKQSDAAGRTSGEGELSQRFIIDSGETRLFTITLSEGQRVELTLHGDETIAFTLLDPLGYPLLQSELAGSDLHEGNATAGVTGPHTLVVERHGGASAGYVNLTSNRLLVPFADTDDLRTIALGRLIEATIDYRGDIDTFELLLSAGDIVNIRADSMMIDPLLEFGLPGAPWSQTIQDDNSGGGPFGLAAEASYYAPITGIYQLKVYDAYSWSTGGYVVEANEWVRGQPTPFVAAAELVEPADAEGELGRFVSAEYPFAMDYPGDWVAGARGELSNMCNTYGGYLEVCLASPSDDALLMILVEDLGSFGLSDMTAEEYSDLTAESMESRPGTEDVTQERLVTSGGLETFIIEGDLAGLFHFVRQVYLHEGLGFNATYLVREDQYDTWAEIITESFRTFEVTED